MILDGDVSEFAQALHLYRLGDETKDTVKNIELFEIKNSKLMLTVSTQHVVPSAELQRENSD